MSENDTSNDNIDQNNVNNVDKNEINANAVNEEWQKKEKELQEKIIEVQNALDKEKSNVCSLQSELKTRTQERDDFKKQLVNLEKELAQRSLKGKNNQDANSKDMVTNARSVIFEKTKVCKNQELQIEALTQQVISLKEIVSITKDMLEIRNMEVKQLRDKQDCLELKFTAEKDRRALMHAKLEKMVELNTELKNEYQKQLQLFSELQKQYHKQQTLSKQINGSDTNESDTTNN